MALHRHTNKEISKNEEKGELIAVGKKLMECGVEVSMNGLTEGSE